MGNGRAVTLQTRLTESLGIELPFVGAGMAFVGETAPLCVATCDAGGVGALAGSFITPERLGEVIDEVRSATAAPFHVNLLVNFDHERLVDVLVDRRVPIVSFHWGLSTPRLRARLRDAGIALWVQVGSVADALAAVDAGADAIVAQGYEAGGHNHGGLPLMALVPSVRDAIGDRLLLAAGGIVDGRTMAAALVLGADGVWVGTRLVATPECDGHPEYKKRLVDAEGCDTELTKVYGPEDPTFNPIRMLRNPTIEAWHHRAGDIAADRSATEPYGVARFGPSIGPVRPHDAFVPTLEAEGDFDLMPLLAGQGVGAIDAIEPAVLVIRRMCADAAALL